MVGHPVLLLEASTWRNLIIHCAARGAYKGAGADALAVSLGRGACDDNDCDHVPEDNEDDLADAVLQICQMAVLGSGDADNVFPDLGLPESLAAAYSEETPWRVAL